MNFLIILLLAFQVDSTAINISLSTEIERTETPMNMPVSIAVVVSWEGKPDRYVISSFEHPVLTNLEVIGSQSVSRTELRNGKIFSVKAYSFSLLPIALGMGYVEPIIVEYTDSMTGIKDYLITQRMSVKGLPPVYEKNYSLILVGAGLVVVAGLLIVLIVMMRRRTIERKLQEIPPALFEDTIIERLQSIHTQDNLSFGQKLDNVVEEFRNFLIKEFEIPENRRSDALIAKTIDETGADENIVSKVKDIFEKVEQLRFSGKTVKEIDFELVLGAVEASIDLCIPPKN